MCSDAGISLTPTLDVPDTRFMHGAAFCYFQKEGLGCRAIRVWDAPGLAGAYVRALENILGQKYLGSFPLALL